MPLSLTQVGGPLARRDNQWVNCNCNWFGVVLRVAKRWGLQDKTTYVYWLSVDDSLPQESNRCIYAPLVPSYTL